MIITQVYYPTDPAKFRKNLKEKWERYPEIGHFNSEESMSKRKDKVLIYHVLDTSVFINKPSDDRGRINITANVESIPGKIELAKSLLEKITEVKLMERE